MTRSDYRRRWRQHYVIIGAIYVLTLIGFQALHVAFASGYVPAPEANLLAGALFYSLNGGLLLTAVSLFKLYSRFVRDHCSA